MSTDYRKFKRIHFIAHASIDYLQQQHEVVVHDLSLKGVHFDPVAVLDIPANVEIDMQLHLDSNPKNDISMTLEIVRSTKHGYSGKWIEIDGDSFSRLTRLLTLNLGSSEQVEREIHELFLG